MSVDKCSVFLQPWADTVCLRKARRVRVNGYTLEMMADVSGFKARVDGMYAHYNEGDFYFFTLGPGKYFFGWDNKVFDISKIRTVEWTKGYTSRNLRFSDESGAFYEFEYHKLGTNLFPPWRLLAYIFDSDWGIYSDLPSFFHSTFSGAAGSFDEIFSDFKKGYEVHH